MPLTADILIWILLPLSIILGILESIGIHFFLPISFRIGVPVFWYKMKVDTTMLNFAQSETFTKVEGKFRFNSNRRVYFRPGSYGRGSLTRNAFLRFFATGKIQEDNLILITARIQFGPAIFLLLASYLWVVLIYSMVSQPTNEISVLIPVMISWMVFLFASIIGFLAERRRMKTMLAELKTIIKERNECLKNEDF